VDSYFSMAAYVVIALVIGGLCGWWARGRRRQRSRSIGDSRTFADVDDLMSMSQQVLTSQRSISTQLNELGSRIEILSHEFLASQRRLATQLHDVAASKEPLDRWSEAAVKPVVDIDRRPGGVTSGYRPARQSYDTTIDAPRDAIERTGGFGSRSAPILDRTHLEGSDSIESAVAEFLVSVDSKEFDNAAVTRFFAERGMVASFVLEFENRWAMIAVHAPSTDATAVGIPAIRVGMRQIDVQPYFDFVNYNGLDPIRGTQVVRVARLARMSGKWTTTQKGIIDGSR
jgi:hypothetical protein